MTPETRASLARRAFLQKPPKIGGIQMRPVTGGTLDLAHELSLTFVENIPGIKDLGEEEARRQFLTWIYIHGAPLEEVIENVFLPPAELRRKMLAFTLQVPAEDIVAPVLTWLIEVRLQCQAAVYEIAPKPEGDTPAPPPPVAPPNS